MIQRILVLVLWLLIATSVSAQVDSSVSRPAVPQSLADSVRVIGKAVTGTAATYSSRADGSKTSSGELFHNSRLTAACNLYPLGSWVRVSNPKNGKSVLVRINDRTSQKKTAPIIQLSRSAVSRLGFLRTGTAKIKIEQISLINYESIVSDTIQDSAARADTVIAQVQADTASYLIKGKSVVGIASYYSSNLDGSKTSTGERYRNNKFTAASNEFALNTWVKVTNLSNGKAVVVRINDRMHTRMKKKGRVIDLSRVAASQLDFMAKGLTRVEVETVVWVKPDSTAALVTDSSQVDMGDSVISKKTSKPDSVTADEGVHYGIASFYSTNLDGTKTATGEIYRNKKLSAASNHFKLNTWVRVTNLKNNRSVVLRINDRMHPRMKAKGRVVDLSRVAAQQLGFMKSGLTRVKVEPVEKGTLN